MKQKMRFTAFISLIITLLSACTAPRVPPRVSLIDLTFGEVALFETTLHTKIRYRNPSSKYIAIRGSNHTLTLNGLEVGSAASDRALTIPALGSATEQLTFYVDNLALIRRLQPLIDSGDLNYELDSTIYTGNFLWGGVTVERKGRLKDFIPLTDELQ